MKMEPIVSSETSAIRTQTPGNYPKRNAISFYTKSVGVCADGKEPSICLVLYHPHPNWFLQIIYRSSDLQVHVNCSNNERNLNLSRRKPRTEDFYSVPHLMSWSSHLSNYYRIYDPLRFCAVMLFSLVVSPYKSVHCTWTTWHSRWSLYFVSKVR